MHVGRVVIKNFRGISHGEVQLRSAGVLLGDNNSGKTSLLEAIELAIGPDRLARRQAIDEHDFYGGDYLDKQISIEVLIAGLDEELASRFRANLEFWDPQSGTVHGASTPDEGGAEPCVRVVFVGKYDPDEDDFQAKTWFCNPVGIGGDPTQEARSSDKREFGFLLLRALRTGNRAMSMERGSLLDVVLRTYEIELKMWERLLDQLRVIPIAGEQHEEFGMVLKNLDTAMKRIVANEWADAPHLRVSELTREDLRHVIRAFMATGAPGHSAPFQHQGSGTTNSLVIAMLSLIADRRDRRVIFAMEEPEISIPPTAQKRVVDLIKGIAGQAIFTTHSPYVLEEFGPENMVVIARDHAAGTISSQSVDLTGTLKLKAFRESIRTRFCEALLSRRVIVTEGKSEAASYPFLAKQLTRADGVNYARLDTRGWAVFDANGETNVAAFASFFRRLGKQVAAVFDQQPEERRVAIEEAADFSFEQPYAGFEEMLLAEVPVAALRRYVDTAIETGEWPTHVKQPEDQSDDEYRKRLRLLLKNNKGDQFAIDLLESLSVPETPATMKATLRALTLATEQQEGSAVSPTATPRGGESTLPDATAATHDG